MTQLTERGELVTGILTARGELVIGGLTATGRIVFPASTPAPEPPIVTVSGGGGGGPRRPILQRAIGTVRLQLYGAAFDRMAARAWAVARLRRSTASAARATAADAGASRLATAADGSARERVQAPVSSRWSTARASVGHAAGRSIAPMVVMFQSRVAAQARGAARAGLLLLHTRASTGRGALTETSAARFLLAQAGRARAAQLDRATMQMLARTKGEGDE